MCALMGALMLGVWSEAAFAEPSETPPTQAATAPDAPDLEADVELTRAAIQSQRQLLVTEAMDLEPSEADVFWPLYLEYRTEMGKVNDRFVTLLLAYLESGGALSNEEAAKALDQYLGIEEERTSVKKTFVPRLRAALPATKVMRFFQVDNKLDALIDAELAAAVPLVR